MRRFMGPALVYALLWGGAFAYWVTDAEQVAAGPLLSLGIFGIVVPLIVHILTIGSPAFPTTEEVSWLEPFALILLVVLAAGFFALGTEFPRALAERIAPGQESVRLIAAALANIVFYIVLPFILMSLFIRHPLSSFGWQSPFRSMLRIRHLLVLLVVGGGIIALQASATPDGMALRDGTYSAGQLALALPAVSIWLVIAGGLAHAFFFRGVLQERIAMLTQNAWAGLFLAALIAALIQVPADIMHAARDADPGQIVAQAILMGSVTGLTFGYVWVRTRNLLLLMLLYAAFSLVSSFASIAGAFGLV